MELKQILKYFTNKYTTLRKIVLLVQGEVDKTCCCCKIDTYNSDHEAEENKKIKKKKLKLRISSEVLLH